MSILVFILGIVIVILLSYIIFMKKEIKNISNQLNEYNNQEVDKKLDINLINKEIEDLAESINKHMDISKKMKIEEVKRKEELKDMIANISHDLRTPLTSIIGYVQILKLNNSCKNEIEYIEKIEKRAKDLKEMLDNFFKLSLIESKEYKIDLEKINLSDIMCDKIIDFYSEFESLNIEPKIEIEEEVFCIGNKSEIERVIENILTNALKNTTGIIKVSLKNATGNVEMKVYNSKDENNIIDKDKVFERFYKGPDRSRRNKNNGIGLSIVKEVIEKMAGAVYVEVDKNSFEITCTLKGDNI